MQRFADSIEHRTEGRRVQSQQRTQWVPAPRGGPAGMTMIGRCARSAELAVVSAARRGRPKPNQRSARFGRSGRRDGEASRVRASRTWPRRGREAWMASAMPRPAVEEGVQSASDSGGVLSPAGSRSTVNTAAVASQGRVGRSLAHPPARAVPEARTVPGQVDADRWPTPAGSPSGQSTGEWRRTIREGYAPSAARSPVVGRRVTAIGPRRYSESASSATVSRRARSRAAPPRAGDG